MTTTQTNDLQELRELLEGWRTEARVDEDLLKNPGDDYLTGAVRGRVQALRDCAYELERLYARQADAGAGDEDTRGSGGGDEQSEYERYSNASLLGRRKHWDTPG